MTIEVSSPFPFAALPRVWHWIAPFREKVADDFSPQDLESFLGRMKAQWDRQKTWAVSADGELGGLVIFERLSKWLGTADVVMKPDFQGRGLAAKACRIAVAGMFEEPGLGKLEFRVLCGNLALGSLICNIGGKREGTLVGHTLSAGKPKDVWLYGLSKAAFEGKSNVVSK
jgi:RimJ/RimL family protein N-acetyltransferase